MDKIKDLKNIHGSDYAMVHERVKAFCKTYENGQICKGFYIFSHIYHEGGNSKFSASGNAKGKGKVGYDEARKTWKNWISRTRKMLGITIKKDDTEYSLRDLKALEQEVALFLFPKHSTIPA